MLMNRDHYDYERFGHHCAIHEWPEIGQVPLFVASEGVGYSAFGHCRPIRSKGNEAWNLPKKTFDRGLMSETWNEA